MNLNLRVLHVLNHSYPYSDGYAIRSYNIINAQRRHGLRPIVLTSAKHEPSFAENPESFEGTAYYRISRPHGDLPPTNVRIIAGLFRELTRIYNKRRFDLIHAHSPSLCGLAAMLFSAQRHVPFVYEVRAFWEDAAVDAGKFRAGSLRYRMERSLETLIFRRASAITTIANYLKRDIEDRCVGNAKVFLVPNGVDYERFQAIPPDVKLQLELGVDPTDNVIGFIGSFYRFEGLNVLLEALAILEKEGMKYKAILAGGGEMDVAWRQLAAALELKDVQFVGRIPHTDVQRYYSIMNMCVYPRLKERITDLVTPLKPLEAMAMGKLVVGSDVGGICELLDSGKGGLLFQAGDADALARLLAGIFANPTGYEDLAAAGKEIVQQRYSWDSHVEKYCRIYNTALSRAEKRR